MQSFIKNMIPIFDIHQDLPGYVDSDDGLRKLIGKYFPFEKEVKERHCDLPSYKKAKVKLIVVSFSLLRLKRKLGRDFIRNPAPYFSIKNKIQFEKSVSKFYQFLKKYPYFEVIKNRNKLQKIFLSNKIGLIFHIEGLYGIEKKEIDWLYNLGFRSFGLTWNLQNDICGTCYEKRGLTKKGREIIQALVSRNIVIDLTHASKKTFWDIMKIKSVCPCIYYSHSAIQERNYHSQSITKKMLIALKQNKGLLGLTLLPSIYQKNDFNLWKEKIIKLMREDYTNVLAFGTDYFGFSFKDSSKGLENIANFINLYKTLKQEISEKDCKKIFYQNAYRFFKRNL